MNKTQLGIRENTYGALLFLLGLAGIFPVIVLTVVAFVMHESDFIKKTALQSVAFMLSIAILNVLLVCLYGAVNLIQVPIFALFSIGSKNYIPSIYHQLKNIVQLMQYIGIFLFAYRAYKEKPIHIPFIDKFVDQCL